MARPRSAGIALAIAAAAAVAVTLVMAVRLRPGVSTADQPEPPAQPTGAAAAVPGSRVRIDGSVTPARPRAAQRLPAPGSVPPPPPPEDDVAYQGWLGQLPEDVMRGEVADIVRQIPGVTLQGLDCRERPCQASIQAQQPAAFDDLLARLHERYRGHILFTASVDHPGAPARVVGSIHIGVPEKLEEFSLGYPR